MKKLILGLVISVMLLGAISIRDGGAQGPPLSLNLVFDKDRYQPTDPIVFELTLTNVSGSPIITSAGFSGRPFHLFLSFLGSSDGKAITATTAGSGAAEGGPPPVINGFAVELVETLASNFKLMVSVSDARILYPLKSDLYQVKATFQMVTYPAIDFTNAEGNFAKVGSGTVFTIESNLVRVSTDTVAPVISGLPASQDCGLSPPNHRLVQVATVTATDTGSGVASLVINGTSNEPENGLGDGDVGPDIFINGGVVQLRAERSGGGDGRTYTLTATAADRAGNAATASGICVVPH